jgi:hypothetical protein
MSKEEQELQRIIKRPRWRVKDAEVIVAAWQHSGKSVTRFSKDWRIDDQRLTRWIHTMQPSEHPEPQEREAAPAPLTFHRVQLPEPASPPDIIRETDAAGQWVAEVSHTNWTVRVPYGFEALELKRLLTVIMEVPSC